ncbi:MAG: hypothetical protein HN337_02340 [Deltaproteobacteria bacterium]|nr:hypothetical protein [Deltaproteobacteria bacterium]
MIIHKRSVLLLFLVIFASSLIGCANTGTEVSNPSDLPTDPQNPVNADGNSIAFDMSNADALVVTSESSTSSSSNFKKVTGSELHEIMSYIDASGQIVKNSTTSPLPSVTHMFTGPNGAVAFMLDSPVSIDNTDCYFFRGSIDSDGVICIDSDLTYLGEFVSTTVHSEFDEETQSYVDYDNVVQPVQFDQDGNIYYIFGHVGMEGHNVYRWSIELGTNEALIDDDITYEYVREYLVANDGSTLINVNESTDEETEALTTQLYRILSNKSMVDTPFDSVYSFTLADDDTILAAGSFDSSNLGLYDVTFDTLSFGELNHRFPLGDDSSFWLEDDDGYLYSGAITHEWQKASDGSVYALMHGVKDQVYGGRQIAKVFSNEIPEFVDTTLSAVKFFRLAEDVLYIAGEDDDGVNVLIKMALSNSGSSESLLEDNIKVYNMVVVDDILIFDGKNMDTNEIIVGQIDMANENEFTELSTEEAHLLGLEAVNQ